MLWVKHFFSRTVLTFMFPMIYFSAASHISQKIKTTYKASTSKIVSSFRQTTQAYSAVRSFHGHKDGVWEVKISKVDPHFIGSASAGNGSFVFFFFLIE